MPGGFHLIPRDERFFEKLSSSASNVATGAAALLELIERYDEMEPRVRRLREIEHEGDEITHSIFDALNRSFVTPFDRSDIGRLASALDDVIDAIEEAAKRFAVYRVDAPTELARRFASVIDRQGRMIAGAVPLLESLRRREGELRRHIIELHRLENEADELLSEALSGLYDGVTDVGSLVRAVQWKDIYELLEDATDRAEHVGIALEAIVVKNG